MFQSPRSGKFESNGNVVEMQCSLSGAWLFQSPKSGKFESNLKHKLVEINDKLVKTFHSPKSGKFESHEITGAHEAGGNEVSIP